MGMYGENPEAIIVRQLVEHVASRIARQTIRQLHAMKSESMLSSGQDSGLVSVWDEVCVQVQHEESVLWDVYIDTMNSIVQKLVGKLKGHEQDAIWLMTPEGQDWNCDNEDTRQPFGSNIDDVAMYILQQYILGQAVDWTNPRIRAYLDRGYEC